ncbi:hypothetical protein DICVIV_05755 [Dictyocaulus viviparus]|uniref:Uncharacterized protein n=1 Tax=Dictyocaulus viviparus TaxID=29172 RepID=A0A0D8Y0K3_DICVI|nr:hypothetical protein DICVIV_05755 [Dictyocaulus viviparus]
MSQLYLLVPCPPIWIIVILNIIILILIVIGFIFILHANSEQLCITPTEHDLASANSLPQKKASEGRVVSKPRSVTNAFTFKNHGDDIGTDMSEDQLQDGNNHATKPFDPKLVAKNMDEAEQQHRIAAAKEVINPFIVNTQTNTSEPLSVIMKDSDTQSSIDLNSDVCRQKQKVDKKKRRIRGP